MKKLIALAVAVVMLLGIFTGCQATAPVETSSEITAEQTASAKPSESIATVSTKVEETGDVIRLEDLGYTREGNIVTHTKSGRTIDLSGYSVALINKGMGSFWFDGIGAEAQNWADAQGSSVEFDYFPATSFTDPATQVVARSSALAIDPDVLVDNPFDSTLGNDAVAPAKEDGTFIVAVEGDDKAMPNIDVFLDPYSYEDLAAFSVESLVDKLGDDITVALFTSTLTQYYHMLLCDLFYDYAAEHYPNMKFVTPKGEYFEHKNTESDAREATKQVIQQYPDVDVLWSASSAGTLGLALGIEELGMIGQVYACGHSRPSASLQALESGSYIFATIHYPGAWGWAAQEAARLLLSGEEITTGTDLGIDGYRNVTVIGRHIYGDGFILLDKDTIDSVVAKYPEF